MITTRRRTKETEPNYRTGTQKVREELVNGNHLALGQNSFAG